MNNTLCQACGCTPEAASGCSVCCYTLKDCLKGFVLLGPRLIKATAESTIDVLHDTFSKSGKPLCHIPETQCPPRCVCEVKWCGSVGDRLSHHVVLTNSGKHKRNFELVALPFSCTDQKVRIAKDFATLSPGDSLKTAIDFVVPKEFAGQTLCAEILVRGAYEQCIRITLDVKSLAESCCDIHQGEIPTRVRAHHWYHHFQCEEPCFEAIPPVRPERGEVGQITAEVSDAVAGKKLIDRDRDSG